MSLFKKLGKAIKKVAKVVAKPVLGTIARTVVGSVPILGGVVSAVGAVKSALRPPTIANTANLSARTGAPAFGHPGIMHAPPRRAPARRRRAPTMTFASWAKKAKRQDAYAREARSQGLRPFRSRSRAKRRRTR